MDDDKEKKPVSGFNPAEVENFRLKEYDRVSSELLAQLEEAWRLEKFAIGGSAALMAWLITNPVSVSWAWLLPLFFVFACFIRFFAAMWHVVFRLGEHLKTIEREFLGESGGWESGFRRKSLNQTIAHGILWISLIALAGRASYLGKNQQRGGWQETGYKVTRVPNGAISDIEIEEALNRESKNGWSLVTIYSSTADEVLIFGRK